MGLISLLLRAHLWDNRRASKEDGHAIEEALDKRPRDPNFVQLSGQTCAACLKRIIAQPDARMCGACDKPIHLKCGERHTPECTPPTR